MYCKVLFPAIIALVVWILILIGFSVVNKQKKKKRQQLLVQIKGQLPILTFKELLQALEALNYTPAQCYFKTNTFERGSVAVDNICLLQRENQWEVCLADIRSFCDEHSFDGEQEACEYFVYKYFHLTEEEIKWLKQ